MQQVCHGAKIKPQLNDNPEFLHVWVNMVLILVLTVKVITHAQNTPCMETAHNTFPLRRLIYICTRRLQRSEV